MASLLAGFQILLVLYPIGRGIRRIKSHIHRVKFLDFYVVVTTDAYTRLLFTFTRDAFGSHLLTYSPTLKVDKKKPKHHNQPDYADYDQLEK
jgi:hypothetical protein